jgi:hypothetical protein
MATSTSPLKIARSGLPRDTRQKLERAEQHKADFKPQLLELRPDSHQDSISLRMYTEEQVAEMLQVSLSKLRKWRMKGNGREEKGPPFKKIGRLVRYPEAGLHAYINTE